MVEEVLDVCEASRVCFWMHQNATWTSRWNPASLSLGSSPESGVTLTWQVVELPDRLAMNSPRRVRFMGFEVKGSEGWLAAERSWW